MKRDFAPLPNVRRATGVLIDIRECRSCGKTFEVTRTAASVACPHCGSHKTIPTRAQGTDKSPINEPKVDKSQRDGRPRE
jgi:predicted RNA-binding Zn-ribbon protein involved in translation (DUF1610 family)